MGEFSDTIAAIATATGRGGIGIVRVSGASALKVGKAVFVPASDVEDKWPPNVLIHGHVLEPEEGTSLDEGFAVFMAAPRTYTGEDVLELQMHGSPVVLQQVLSLCLRMGCRLALPGEFTQRAYRNGKMDLIQAEAVAELISAESEEEARAARRRLEGVISREVEGLREATLDVLAEIEADVDFPEEDLDALDFKALAERIGELSASARRLRQSYEANRRLSEGFRVVLAGRANVGKSSLFNALLQSSRAIVSVGPGTTRDVLREERILSGRRVSFVDTAGIQTSEDEVESEGVRRARGEIETADMVLHVLDSSKGMTVEDIDILPSLPADRTVRVWNKIDIAEPPQDSEDDVEVFHVSALRGDGISSLLSSLGESAVSATAVGPGGGIASDRQREIMDDYINSLNRAAESVRSGLSPDLLAFDLRQGHNSISGLLAEEGGAEPVLDRIFSRFCIGK